MSREREGAVFFSFFFSVCVLLLLFVFYQSERKMLTSNALLKSQVYAKLSIGERNKTTILEMCGDVFFIAVIMIGKSTGLYWVRCRETKPV